jgi:L-threonylcarbamoyladenylate synthase
MTTTAEMTQAIDILSSGGLIGLPTETVYGLAADAENELAVRSIFAAKGRPVDHPLIVHLASAAQIRDWAIDIPAAAWRLADAFWPGPLTLILKSSGKAAPAVTGGLSTIGLRVPSHPIAQLVLREFGGGLAAPSANRFGRVSPTLAKHVRTEFGPALPLVLDGGPCAVGVESTIVDLSSGDPTLLRPGKITSEEIERVLAQRLGDPAKNTTRTSGRLESHYAPRAAVEITAPERLAARVRERVAEGLRVAVIANEHLMESAHVFHRPMPSDAAGFARQLYAALHEVDAQGVEIALVVPPTEVGVGVAVADRLRKAAAPRPAGIE